MNASNGPQWFAGLVLIAAVTSSPAIMAQPWPQTETPVTVPARPAERLPDGTVNLGITLEDKGMWLPRDRTELGRRSTLAPVETIPFQPWARALYEERQIHELEPHTRCKASGVARQFQTPYGVDFVHLPDLNRILIFDVGGPHTFRIIHMDGRPHPSDLTPSYYGHSVGWWDDDTLVVETVGFNEDFWIDRTGLPHTEKLRTVERFTRVDFETMAYEVLIDDPNVYTRPWTGGFDFGWIPDIELFEYICQDYNTAPELMTMDGAPIDFGNPWTP